MPRYCILFLLQLVLLSGLQARATAADDTTIYVIKKGDTLWGLSEKFLNDPQFWPDLWSKNREITNPHLIYPGQRVRFVVGKLEIVTEAALPKALEARPVVEQPQEVAEERTFTARGNEGGLLEEEDVQSGIILAGQHGRVLIGEEDTVFTDIGTNRQGTEGQQYTILHSSAVIRHPVTNEKLGKRVVPLGSLQLARVTESGSRAIINRSFREIAPGSLLVPYRNLERREISLKVAARSLNGMIVESYAGNNALSQGDVVYIDLGSSNGVEEGNLLYVVREVVMDDMPVDPDTVTLPHEVVGAVVVVHVGKRTSTALLIKSIDAIFKKDMVISAPR
jgi:hypothetical protein